MTHYILAYVMCDVYFLCKTSTSLGARNVSGATSSQIKGRVLNKEWDFPTQLCSISPQKGLGLIYANSKL